MSRGCFIVLEGIDGAGTTTQAVRLEAALRGRGIEVTRTFEPSDGPVGRLIRSSLRREEGAPARKTLPWMFAADRSDHLARVVEPALEAGQWVISDRYLPSSLAYQSLDFDYDLVWGLNRRFLVPDLVLFLDLPARVAMQRIAARSDQRDIFEEEDLLARVSQSYKRAVTMLSAKPRPVKPGWPIVEVDATRSPDEVYAACLASIETCLFI